MIIKFNNLNKGGYPLSIDYYLSKKNIRAFSTSLSLFMDEGFDNNWSDNASTVSSEIDMWDKDHLYGDRNKNEWFNKWMFIDNTDLVEDDMNNNRCVILMGISDNLAWMNLKSFEYLDNNSIDELNSIISNSRQELKYHVDSKWWYNGYL